MNPRTRRALLGSIKKWEAIAAGTEEDHGTLNCPLCKLFYEDDCIDCPVFLATRTDLCQLSPYDDWCDHIEQIHNTGVFKIIDNCPECLRLAQAELDFLKSLLPPPTPK